MTLFDESIALKIIGQVQQRYLDLGDALGVPRIEEDHHDAGYPGRLRQDLLLLIGVANGEYHRTKEVVHQVEPALTRLLDLLLGNALSTQPIMIPNTFWKTDVGIVISRVRWWISVDDLITISNAAALAFGENTQANRMRIVRAIDNGLLEWVPDPSVANPQQQKRVLRPQVEHLRDQRRLPE